MITITLQGNRIARTMVRQIVRMGLVRFHWRPAILTKDDAGNAYLSLAWLWFSLEAYRVTYYASHYERDDGLVTWCREERTPVDRFLVDGHLWIRRKVSDE